MVEIGRKADDVNRYDVDADETRLSVMTDEKIIKQELFLANCNECGNVDEKQILVILSG